MPSTLKPPIPYNDKFHYFILGLMKLIENLVKSFYLHRKNKNNFGHDFEVDIGQKQTWVVLTLAMFFSVQNRLIII